jgi:hypothetical protein
MKFKPRIPLAGAVHLDPQPETADLSQFELTVDLLKCLPGTIARRYEALPVGLHGGTLWIAVAKETCPQVMFGLQSLLGRKVRFFLVNREPLRVLLNHCYGVDDNQR